MIVLLFLVLIANLCMMGMIWHFISKIQILEKVLDKFMNAQSVRYTEIESRFNDLKFNSKAHGAILDLINEKIDKQKTKNK